MMSRRDNDGNDDVEEEEEKECLDVIALRQQKIAISHLLCSV